MSSIGPSLAAPDPAAAIERGLAVFPLPPGSKVAPKGWQHTVTHDLGQARATFPTGSNIGIACRVSNIVGIDLDRHTAGGANAGVDGVAAFEALCRRWGQDRPVTLEIATPHNGRHLLFRVPAGLVVPSVSGTSRLGPGIDIRGPGSTLGGYLAGPGSIVDDRQYLIAVDAPIARLPGWLAALIGRRPEAQKSVSRTRSGR